MSFLSSLLERAISGHGALALISGEAGIGKSRIAEEIGDRAVEAGGTVLWGRCWEGEDVPRLWPWRQIAEGIPGEIQGLAPTLAGTGNHFSAAQQLLTAFAKLDHPVMCILDDLHAADEPSLHCLLAVAQQTARRPVLILGTYREQDVEPGSVAARILTSVGRLGESMTLRGLDAEDVATCFEQVAGHPPPPSVASSVSRATGGNPFLVREMARQVAGGRGIQRPDRSVGFRIPTGARELITQRLDHLANDVRELLRAAAVIGYEFDAALLEHIAPLGRDRILDALSREVGHGLLEEQSALGRYAFSHVLVREALYEELSGSERAQLHAGVARATEELHAQDLDSHVGVLAQHYFKAGASGDLDKALHYASEAGRRALENGQFDDASRHLYRAVKVAEGPGGDEATREGLAGLLTDAEAAARVAIEEIEPAVSQAPNSLRREGEYWTIEFAGVASRLKDTKGLRYLAELIRAPDREFLALDLVAGSDAARVDRHTAEDAGLTPGAGDAGEVLDSQAKARYRRRLEDLQDEIEEAEAFNDPERAARAKEEMDFLARELAAGVGLGERPRKASSATDRARMSVTRALRSAIDRIAEANPVLGRHLEATIKTGTYVSYTPDPRVPVDWRV